jgi:hypothetical protein
MECTLAPISSCFPIFVPERSGPFMSRYVSSKWFKGKLMNKLMSLVVCFSDYRLEKKNLSSIYANWQRLPFAGNQRQSRLSSMGNPLTTVSS